MPEGSWTRHIHPHRPSPERRSLKRKLPQLVFSSYQLFFLKTICSLCFFTTRSKNSLSRLYSSGMKKERLIRRRERSEMVPSASDKRYSNSPSSFSFSFTTICFGNSSTTYPAGIWSCSKYVSSSLYGISTG